MFVKQIAASGFDFEPLPDGFVLIEFFADDGKTINQQTVTAEVVRRMPLVAALLDVAARTGPDVVSEIVKALNQGSFHDEHYRH